MATSREDPSTPKANREPATPTEVEMKLGLWKLLLAAAGILVLIFVAMELVDDTYTLPSQTTLSIPRDTGSG
jgi:hypothetical protein